MTTRPVAVNVSQATRLYGSSARHSSRMAWGIWSAILSGWPSVTDYDVHKKRSLAKGLSSCVDVTVLANNIIMTVTDQVLHHPADNALTLPGRETRPNG